MGKKKAMPEIVEIDKMPGANILHIHYHGCRCIMFTGDQLLGVVGDNPGYVIMAMSIGGKNGQEETRTRKIRKDGRMDRA